MENNHISKTVMVVGCTGYLGMEICRQLVAGGKKVKGLIRTTSDTAKIDTLKQMGVETIIGDIKDRQSLAAAFKNVNSVISTASSTLSRQEGDSIETVDQEGQLNVVDAAKNAGVKHLVFISFNPIAEEFPLQTAKRKVEESIKNSGLTYTILQPTMFMEVWLSPAIGFDYPNSKVNIYGEGKNKLSWIAIADVAAFAVASLDNPNFEDQTVELGGPEALSPLEVVKIFEDSTGKQFDIQHIPEEALRSQKEAATDSLSKSFAGLMLSYSYGANIDMSATLESVPLNLTSVKSYAQRVTKRI